MNSKPDHSETANPLSGQQNLGALAPDDDRTILVVSKDGELAVALRDKIDRAYAVVRDVRPAEAADGIAACLPWPWMVVSDLETVSADLSLMIRTRPILVFWLGALPKNLPAHAHSFDRFIHLAEATHDALTHVVCGMRLAIGIGVELPDGSIARSAELQALVSGFPTAFEIPLEAFRSAQRVLKSNDIPLQLTREAGTGRVAMVPTELAYAG
jgi:hypothetical protein